ncbi:MAG: DUF1127 domain-containing protein [Alphaproteobacteria bacterium]
MPAYDVYLRPEPYSVRRPKRRYSPVAAAWVLVSSWIERARQRGALAALNDHELRDIGITRVEAVREAQKSFWR